MEIPATVTSKGQVTVPAALRKALGLEAGDRVLFRLVEGRARIEAEDAADRGAPSAEMEKAPDFFALAGSVAMPKQVDPPDWPSQREAGWTDAVRSRE